MPALMPASGSMVLDQSRAIPVTVLTGFLGAGKTTLLNHLLHQPALADAAVLINEVGEFGEFGVDHHLVDKIDDNIVLIETTGLADPAPVLYTLLEDFFIAERYRIDGVVAAVDVTHANGQLSRHFAAVKQVTMADRLLLTKCDLATPDEIAVVSRRLARANPGAPQIKVRQGVVDVAQVMGCGLYDPQRKTADVGRWLAEEKVRAAASDHDTHSHDPSRHDALVQAFALRFKQPFIWPEFTEAIDVLLATCGERILRVKGLIHIEGESAPRVVQCVQHIRYPESALPAWPDDDHDSRLVFIVRALAKEHVEKAFAMFCDAQAVEAGT